MNIIHEQVRHRQFGEGVITERQDSMITVRFGGEVGSKRFIYPCAFEGFLTFLSEQAQREADDEIRQLHELEQQRLRQQKAAEEKRAEARKLALLTVKSRAKKASDEKRAATRVKRAAMAAKQS